jgi:hypothetical protein
LPAGRSLGNAGHRASGPTGWGGATSRRIRHEFGDGFEMRPRQRFLQIELDHPDVEQ